jgi:hypothetical protein
VRYENFIPFVLRERVDVGFRMRILQGKKVHGTMFLGIMHGHIVEDLDK